MKKIVSILATVVLLATAILPLSAASFENAIDLIEYWGTNDAFPDYICGVWSNDGTIYNLTISILDTPEGNAGKEEILSLVHNSSAITFVYGEYSRNQLIAIQNEILPAYVNQGIIYTGYLDTENRICIGILEDHRWDPATDALKDKLREIYGDIFIFEYSDKIITYTLLNEIENDDPDNRPAAFLIFSAVLLLAAVVTVMFVRRTVAVRLSNGETTVSPPVSLAETEAAIKQSQPQFPTNLDEKILSNLPQDTTKN